MSYEEEDKKMPRVRDKPCPFCGNAIRLIHVCANYRYVCDNCDMTFEVPMQEDKEDTIDTWNRRSGSGYFLLVDEGDKIELQGVHSHRDSAEITQSLIKRKGYTTFRVRLDDEDGIVRDRCII